MSTKGQLNLWDHLRNIIVTFCHKYVLDSETSWYMYCDNFAWLSIVCNNRVHDKNWYTYVMGQAFAVTYQQTIFSKATYFNGEQFHHVLMVGRCYPPLLDAMFLCLISIMQQRNDSGVFHHKETVIASKYASLVGHKLHLHCSRKLIPVSGHSHQISKQPFMHFASFSAENDYWPGVLRGDVTTLNVDFSNDPWHPQPHYLKVTCRWPYWWYIVSSKCSVSSRNEPLPEAMLGLVCHLALTGH